MFIIRHKLMALIFALGLSQACVTYAAEYLVDTSGAHASVNFKFDHLGIGRIIGSFRKFSGSFFYDPENLSVSWVKVDIDVASLDSNQATRDRNIRSALFLDVEQFPTASFVSSSIASTEQGDLRIFGELTLHGISRKIELQGRKTGEMTDEWGRHRVGFEASTTLHTLDFDMVFPPSNQVTMELYLEGVQKPGKKVSKNAS